MGTARDDAGPLLIHVDGDLAIRHSVFTKATDVAPDLGQWSGVPGRLMIVERRNFRQTFGGR
jgi:hypothetical protein